MARRSPARFIAPLALVAAVVATLLVVQGTRSDGGSTTTPTTQADGTGTQATATTSTTSAGGRKRRAKVYVVKPGDILTTVSEQTGLSVERLEELNPGLDPQSLQVGQKLKLVEPAGGTPTTTTGTDTTTIP